MGGPAWPGTPVPPKQGREHGQGRDESGRDPGSVGNRERDKVGHPSAQDSPQTCHLNSNLEAPLQPPQGLCVLGGSLSPHFLQPHPQLTQPFPEQPGK